MAYNALSNEPFLRNRVTHSYVWWSDAFSLDELNKLNNLCDMSQLQEAITTDKDRSEVRKSRVNFFDRNKDTEWIFDRFNNVARNINDRFYGFDLYGYSQFQYTVYEKDEEYRWHMDTILGDNFNGLEAHSTRKLSLVLLLSEPEKDFTGGEFLFNLSSEEKATTVDLKKGMLLAFPSFVIHKVKPVLSGVRKSIVIWIEGPKFR